MKYIASCSFGKDSLAQILVGLEHGEPLMLRQLQDTPGTSRTFFTKSKSLYYFESKFKEENNGRAV